MRYKLFLALVFISSFLQAQQINPVPDYVFANRMSVGRNTVTDTAAYFSVGPRFGAVRGMMPPMVADTANVSSTKRNGLLIFSMQKNKYLYWDSVGAKWAEMAGTTGTALTSGDTATMLNAYTRGSGTVNYLPKFTGTRTLGNSLIFDDGTNVGIATASPGYKLDVAGDTRLRTNVYLATGGTSDKVGIGTTSPSSRLYVNTGGTGGTSNGIGMDNAGAQQHFWYLSDNTTSTYQIGSASGVFRWVNSNGELARINASGELQILSSTDAGAYALQVTGSTYTTAGAVFNPSASSSNYLLMGTTTVRETSGIARGAIQVTGSAGNTGGIIIAGQLANNANGDYLQFIKSRGTSNVAVQSGDDLGGITLAGADGTNYLRGARIRAVVDGTPGTNDMPTRLEFSVTQDGNASPTYWMALNNDGELIIQENPVDAGAYKLQVAGNIYSTGSLTTGAPSGGSIKPWKIGEAATVSPTSPNRTIRVEIDGTVYYIHAKTTND